jgi:MoaA/NifB/PqqE/SkfB family radical SAM enzyme
MALDAVWDGAPGVCHFAITSACNARCGFCSFARDRLPASSRHSATLAEAKLACDILKRNGIGFVHFTGGEPLVHRDFTAIVAYAAQIGMITTLVTNGALLTQKRVDALAEAGLASVYISIDAASYRVHDSNRGLPGLSACIRRANAVLKRRQIPSSASVTMSRLVDYPTLPEALRDLGFGAVTFSYPLRTLPSSYLACAESPLVDFTPEELHASFEAVKALNKQFPVLNPVASIDDMQRHLRGEPEVRVPRGLEILLFGLASAAQALPQLGPAALRHPRVRRNAVRARRLHRLYD